MTDHDAGHVPTTQRNRREDIDELRNVGQLITEIIGNGQPIDSRLNYHWDRLCYAVGDCHNCSHPAYAHDAGGRCDQLNCPCHHCA